jgi:peptidoglycan L-alanyl-D-glutamate endopeptidase CwlK
MPTYSKESLEKLGTCDERLQRVFNKVIQFVDCTIICGHRGEADQNAAYASGASKVKYPNGKHNSTPSKAVDVMPYPVNYSEDAKNIEAITLFAGFVLGIAAEMEIKLRWGHDWDSDMVPDTRGLVDRPHYEVID